MRLHQSAGERKFLAATIHTSADTANLLPRFAFTFHRIATPQGEWTPGEWLESTKTARILVGAGALTLPLGVVKVWVSVSNGTEVVIDLLGHIRVI